MLDKIIYSVGADMVREDTENMRRMRAAEKRSPVENAYLALCSLSQDDRVEAVNRFNNTYNLVNSVPTLSFVRQTQ